MNEYHEQARQFLDRNGIKFRATLSDSKPAPWDVNGKHGHHYRITLSKAYRYSGPSLSLTHPDKKRGRRLTFDFWGSIADAEAGKTEIDAYDVLACVSGDVNCPETFADFCGEYGYDTDSISVKQSFTRCSRFAKRLREFFTAQEIEQLQEIQ